MASSLSFQGSVATAAMPSQLPRCPDRVRESARPAGAACKCPSCGLPASFLAARLNNTAMLTVAQAPQGGEGIGAMTFHAAAHCELCLRHEWLRWPQTAVHVAARNNHTAVLAALLRDGDARALAARDGAGLTPLDTAALAGAADAALYLIQIGAPVQYDAPDILSPLHFACAVAADSVDRAGEVAARCRIVCALIENGASAAVRAFAGKSGMMFSPGSIAAASGAPELCHALKYKPDHCRADMDLLPMGGMDWPASASTMLAAPADAVRALMAADPGAVHTIVPCIGPAFLLLAARDVNDVEGVDSMVLLLQAAVALGASMRATSTARNQTLAHIYTQSAIARGDDAAIVERVLEALEVVGVPLAARDIYGRTARDYVPSDVQCDSTAATTSCARQASLAALCDAIIRSRVMGTPLPSGASPHSMLLAHMQEDAAGTCVAMRVVMQSMSDAALCDLAAALVHPQDSASLDRFHDRDVCQAYVCAVLEAIGQGGYMI